MQLFAVTGSPVSHSLSPNAWNYAFKKLGINAQYFRFHADSAGEVIELIKEIGITACNVTAPFKEDIISHLDSVSKEAMDISAVNAIVFDENKLYGDNVDIYGVIGSLSANGFNPRNKKTIVLGAGGAARSAVYALRDSGARVVAVNRTYGRAKKLAEQFNSLASPLESVEEEIRDADLLINCVSTTERVLKKNVIHKGLTILDANYREESILKKDAADIGCKFIDGSEWLIYQAEPFFKRFFDEDPIKYMKEGLTKALQDRKNKENKKQAISLIGFMGVGKTVIGEKLSSELGFDFIELDSLIEKKEGRSIPLIFKESGEEYFRKIEKKVLNEIEFNRPIILACGGGVVLDPKNRKLLKENTNVFWLWSNLETAVSRVKKGTRPLLVGNDAIDRAKLLLEKRIPIYAETSDVCLSTNKSVKEVVKNISNEIKNY